MTRLVVISCCLFVSISSYVSNSQYVEGKEFTTNDRCATRGEGQIRHFASASEDPQLRGGDTREAKRTGSHAGRSRYQDQDLDAVYRAPRVRQTASLRQDCFQTGGSARARQPRTVFPREPACAGAHLGTCGRPGFELGAISEERKTSTHPQRHAGRNADFVA